MKKFFKSEKKKDKYGFFKKTDKEIKQELTNKEYKNLRLKHKK